MVSDTVDVEEAAHQCALDGEVDVLRDVADQLRGADGVELAHHHVDNVLGAVEQRTAAVVRRHRRGDLEPLRVVAKAADVAARHVELLRQEAQGYPATVTASPRLARGDSLNVAASLVPGGASISARLFTTRTVASCDVPARPTVTLAQPSTT